jgi:hypothetical protein
MSLFAHSPTVDCVTLTRGVRLLGWTCQSGGIIESEFVGDIAALTAAFEAAL